MKDLSSYHHLDDYQVNRSSSLYGETRTGGRIDQLSSIWRLQRKSHIINVMLILGCCASFGVASAWISCIFSGMNYDIGSEGNSRADWAVGA